MENYKNGGDGVFDSGMGRKDTDVGLLTGGTEEGFNITHD